MKSIRFQYIGGKVLKPISPSLLQTDGSFYPFTRTGKAAVLLSHNSKVYTKLVTLQKPEDSYETEWASVFSGLLFALKHNVSFINIENDNEGVVKNIISGKMKGEKPYVTEYREAILALAKQTQWTGIRWIPRKQNRADDLFR